MTTADVTGLNRAAMARTTAYTRMAGTAAIVIGAVAAVGWAWLTVRTQGQIDNGNVTLVGAEPPNLDLADRLDVAINSLVLLVYAALVAGLGFALRLGVDYASARTGGSLSGLEVGDELAELDAGEGA